MHVILLLIAVIWFIAWRVEAARQARANLAAQAVILAALAEFERRLDRECDR
jgi:hypothetical protein